MPALPNTSSFGYEVPIEDTSRAFSPFSIILPSGMKDLSGDDKAYNDFRSHFIEVVFSPDLSNKMGPHQVKAGIAIKRLINMALNKPVIYFDDNDLYTARQKGIVIEKGKGITLAEPELIISSMTTERSHGDDYLRITPLLIEYAQKNTKTK
jgi:hypothetical protein